MTPSVKDSSSVSAFLVKLWNMVNDSSTDNLISWSKQGNSFVIRNQTEFAQNILPSYYKHNNMSSFIRQLNMYGFRKHVNPTAGCLKPDSGDLEFSHHCFIMRRPELLPMIKRKMVPAEKVNINAKPIGSADSSNDSVLQQVLNEVRNLKEVQDFTKSQLCNMQRENEILWREVAILRQKQTAQQHIMNRLIRFLITLARTPGTNSNSNSNRRRFLPLMIKDNSNVNHAFNSQRHFNSDVLSPSGPTILELDASDMLEVQMDSPIANVITPSPHIATNQSDSESIASSPLSFNGERNAADREIPQPELTVVPTKLLVPVTFKDHNTSRRGLLLPTGQVTPETDKSNRSETNYDIPSPLPTCDPARIKVNLGPRSAPTQIAPSSTKPVRMKLLKYEPPPNAIPSIRVNCPIEKESAYAQIETNASDRAHLAPSNQNRNFSAYLNWNFKRLLNSDGEGPSGMKTFQKVRKICPGVEGVGFGASSVDRNNENISQNATKSESQNVEARIASDEALTVNKGDDYVLINGKPYRVKKLRDADGRVNATNLTAGCAPGVDTAQLTSLLVEEEVEGEGERKLPYGASMGEDESFSWGLLEEPQYSPVADDDYEMGADESVLEDMRDKLNAIEYAAVRNEMRRTNRGIVRPRKRKSANVRKLVRKSKRTKIDENARLANDAIEADEYVLGLDDLNGLTIEQAREVENILRNRPTTVAPQPPYSATQRLNHDSSAAETYGKIDARNAVADASGENASLDANSTNEVPFESRSGNDQIPVACDGIESNLQQAIAAQNENTARDSEIQSYGTIEDELNEILRNMGDPMLSQTPLRSADATTHTPPSNDHKFNGVDDTLSLARYDNGTFGNFSTDVGSFDLDTLNQADTIASDLEKLKKCVDNERVALDMQALWGIMNQSPLNYNLLSNPDQNKQRVEGNELVSVNGRNSDADEFDLSDFMGSSFDWNILSPDPRSSFVPDPGYPELNTPICERTTLNEFIANPTQEANSYNAQSDITR